MPPKRTDESDSKNGPVLDPEELDITDDDHVEEIGDGRYVVSGDPSGPAVPASDRADPEELVDETPAKSEPAPTPAATADAVNQWLVESLADNGFTYGFDATLKFEGEINRHRMVSNDITTTFETLVLWFARHVESDMSAEEVLGILLAESDLRVRHPTKRLQALLDRHDLTAADSIADLVDAVNDEGSVVFDTR